MHLLYLVLNFQSIRDDIKNVRWIPYYPRLFIILIAANTSIVSTFLLGKWFIASIFEIALLVCDGVVILLVLGLGSED